MSMHHVIIGAGPAGVIAAETLHKLDPGAKITLVGDEPEPPYSRMAIPYYLIDRIGEDGTYLRKTEGYYQGCATTVVQDRVESVLTADSKVQLAKGGALDYDRLLVATGARAIRAPIDGVDSPAVHSCWTLQDARDIAALAKPGAKVVLMGAGFIGSIILEALASRGVDLTVVEMENRMVPRMMNDSSGGLIKSWCESKGVTVLTSSRVGAIDKGSGGNALSVVLETGDALPADLVICATGVRANVEFLKDSGVEVDQGVLVDEYLQTSDAKVFAAGDVAQGKDFSTGEYSVQAIQPTAADHGRIAAANMVSERALKHQGSVNMNVLDTMGLVSSSFGLWQGVAGGESAELSDPARYRYLSLQFEDDILVGANSLGLIQHVGVLRGLIQGRLRLGVWKDRLRDDPTRIMEAYVSATQGLGVTSKAL
jgi:NADPH-dependent 2,4-dienoyl-CoA reductase/sulfur reductase-like enzyme